MKKSFIVKGVIGFLLASLFVSCFPSYNSVKRMQKMEENVSNPTTKEELEEAIVDAFSYAKKIIVEKANIIVIIDRIILPNLPK